MIPVTVVHRSDLYPSHPSPPIWHHDCDGGEDCEFCNADKVDDPAILKDMKKTKLNKDLLADTNIPKRFWELNCDTYFGSPSALEATKKYVHNFSKAYSKGVGILYIGQSPSCKTFLATTLLKALLVEGMHCVYYSLDELFELYISGDSAGSNFLKSFKEAQCVVIDNVGVSPKEKTGIRNALEKVVTFRSDNGLPYVICSTLGSINEIRENWGFKISGCCARDLQMVECDDVSAMLKGKQDQAKLEVFGGEE